MPMSNVHPADFKFLYICIEVQDRTRSGRMVTNYEFAMYSGHVDMVDFAIAVERNWRRPHLCHVFGANGPCYITNVQSSVIRSVMANIGWECFVCGRHAGQMSACSGCGFVRYCSTECQRVHWRAGHRNDCNRIVFDRRARNLGRESGSYVYYGQLSSYEFNLYNHLFSQLLA